MVDWDLVHFFQFLLKKKRPIFKDGESRRCGILKRAEASLDMRKNTVATSCYRLASPQISSSC